MIPLGMPMHDPFWFCHILQCRLQNTWRAMPALASAGLYCLLPATNHKCTLLCIVVISLTWYWAALLWFAGKVILWCNLCTWKWWQQELCKSDVVCTFDVSDCITGTVGGLQTVPANLHISLLFFSSWLPVDAASSLICTIEHSL